MYVVSANPGVNSTSNLFAMKVIIAWSCRGIRSDLEQMSLAEDVEGLRRLNGEIERANRVWLAWLNNGNGSVIEFHGADGKAEIEATKLSELIKIKQQIEGTLENDVALGAGTKLTEARTSLAVSEARGGNRIVLYSEDVQAEFGKIKDEEAGRDDPLKSVDLSKADNQGGHEGKMHPSAPVYEKKKFEGSEHSQGEVAQAAVDDQPPATEKTHSSEDFEDKFHEIAGQAESEEAPPNEAQDRSGIVQVLQQLKSQMPVLEQVKQAAPETYQAVMGLAQAVIAMAKQMNGDPSHTTQREVEDRAKSDASVQLPPEQEEEEGAEEEPAQKSEGPFDLAKMAIKDLKAGKKLPPDKTLWPEDRHPEYDYSHLLSPEHKAAGYQLKVKHPKDDSPEVRMYSGGTAIGQMATRHEPDVDNDPIHIQGASLQPEHRNKGLGGAMYEALFVHALKKMKVKQVVGGVHSSMASRVHQKLAAKHGLDYKPEPNDLGQIDARLGPSKTPGEYDNAHAPYEYALKGEMDPEEKPLDKATLTAKPTGKGRHHIVLPVGSHKDPGPTAAGPTGKIKVFHSESGKEGWIQARAGMVQSADSHPVSSKNPRGK